MHIQRLCEARGAVCTEQCSTLSEHHTDKMPLQHRSTLLQSEKQRNAIAPARMVDVACNVALVCGIYAMVSVHSKEVEAQSLGCILPFSVVS